MDSQMDSQANSQTIAINVPKIMEQLSNKFSIDFAAEFYSLLLRSSTRWVVTVYAVKVLFYPNHLWFAKFAPAFYWVLKGIWEINILVFFLMYYAVLWCVCVEVANFLGREWEIRTFALCSCVCYKTIF